MLKTNLHLLKHSISQPAHGFIRVYIPEKISADLITQSYLCNIQRFLKAIKMIIFKRKEKIFFLIFAQNIDCGYTLHVEPPQCSKIRLWVHVRTTSMLKT